MKIKMMNKHGRNAVQNAIVEALLAAHKPIQIEQLFIRFEVDEWDMFLSILWLAYAAASYQSDGDSMRQRYNVSVKDDKGNEWHTVVWYDEEEKCIRYGCLY